MRHRLIDFFKRNAPDHDPEELTFSILELVEYHRTKEAQRSIEARSFDTALQKIDEAIATLEKIKGDRANHLLNNLQVARHKAGDHRSKDPVIIDFIHIPAPDFEKPRTMSSAVTPTAKNARLIFNLESFWFRTFGKRPKNYRDHKFFELAAIVCPGPGGRESEATAIHKQRNRTAKPLKEEEEEGDK